MPRPPSIEAFVEAGRDCLPGLLGVALADTCCGYGTVASLAEGATGFTTVELKANFVGTARAGGQARTSGA